MDMDNRMGIDCEGGVWSGQRRTTGEIRTTIIEEQLKTNMGKIKL